MATEMRDLLVAMTRTRVVVVVVVVVVVAVLELLVGEYEP